LSSDGLSAYIAQNNIEFPVVTSVPIPVAKVFGFGGTPETFLVSREGIVIDAWSGAFDEKIRPGIENRLHVKLPGLPSC
jgi:hypothetical protein